MHVITSKKSVKSLVVEIVAPEILRLLEAAGHAAETEGMAAYAVGASCATSLLALRTTMWTS